MDETIRVILIYCRSDCVPDCTADEMALFYSRNPNCVIDVCKLERLIVVYLHDKPSEENKVQTIYETLEILETNKSRSYEMVKSQKRYLWSLTC